MGIGPLVDAGWLRERLEDDALVVVDCRFVLGSPDAGRRAWEEAHIPGAAFLSVEDDLSGPPGGAAGGRHPLPSAETFSRAASGAGIGPGVAVVAYDDAGEGGAARLWWLLRHFGHEEVAVLDGGLRGWLACGGPVDQSPPRPGGGPFVARERAGDIVSAAEVAAGGLSLVDARAAERFRGEVEPIDPVAGHIPGARNVPFASLAPGGRFVEPEALRAALGPGFVAYCGSGITASTLVLAAAVAGVPARLYPGSWSEWCARGLPVERGD
jgi:thiosulfate/3-mercaptopyruvate sulfurtransferase